MIVCLTRYPDRLHSGFTLTELKVASRILGKRHTHVSIMRFRKHPTAIQRLKLAAIGLGFEVIPLENQ